MARDLPVSCPKQTWTELTSADETGDVTVVLLRAGKVFLQRSTGTAPSANNGVILLAEGDGWNQSTLAEIFPGGSGSRLWAYPTDSDVEIYFSGAAGSE